MKDEIKEILDNIKTVIDEGHYRATCDIDYEDCKILLDYITNLQEKIHKKEAMYDSLAVDYRLAQEEIERLNNIINELEKYIGIEWYCFDNESVEFQVAKDILNKIKELKEKSDKE